MKKLYSTPAMEVKSFEAEDIMTTSSTHALSDSDLAAKGTTTAQAEVNYNTLFNLD